MYRLLRPGAQQAASGGDAKKSGQASGAPQGDNSATASAGQAKAGDAKKGDDAGGKKDGKKAGKEKNDAKQSSKTTPQKTGTTEQQVSTAQPGEGWDDLDEYESGAAGRDWVVQRLS